MSDKAVVDRVMQLKSEVERAATEVARLEAGAELAEKRAAEIDAELTAAGFDPKGDLAAQLRRRTAAVEDDVRGVLDALRELREAASEVSPAVRQQP